MVELCCGWYEAAGQRVSSIVGLEALEEEEEEQEQEEEEQGQEKEDVLILAINTYYRSEDKAAHVLLL